MRIYKRREWGTIDTMTSTVLSIFLATISISFCLAYISVLSKFKKTNIALGKMFLANNVLKEYIEKQKTLSTINEEEIHQENFIKFLSDSRDWAFNYIEEVQKGLEDFINSVDSHVAYFDESELTFSTEQTHHVAMKQISKSYKELKKLLPKEAEKQ